MFFGKCPCLLNKKSLFFSKKYFKFKFIIESLISYENWEGKEFLVIYFYSRDITSLSSAQKHAISLDMS